jgi:hypothetical protein
MELELIPVVERDRKHLMTIMTNMTIDGTNVFIHNQNLHNLLLGVLTRVFCVKYDGVLSLPIPIDEPYVRRWSRAYDRALKRHFKPARILDTEEIPLAYDGAKRAAYQNAASAYELYGWEVADTRMKCFGKLEKLEKKRPGEPIDQQTNVCRIVQPASLKANLFILRSYRPFRKQLKRAIRKTSNVEVMSGLNSHQMGERFLKIINAAGPGAIVLLGDAVKYDIHTRQVHLRLEDKLHIQWVERFGLFNSPDEKRQYLRELKWLLHRLENPTKYITTPDAVIKFKRIMRCSGTVKTSDGNVYNMSKMQADIETEVDYEIWPFNAGDDFGFVLKHDTDVDAFTNTADTLFRRHGYVMEWEEPELADSPLWKFCQARFFRDRLTAYMLRDNRALQRDHVSLKQITNHKLVDMYRGAISDCGLAAFGDMPVLGSYYNYLGRASGTRRPKTIEHNGLYYLSRNMRKKFQPPTPELRQQYEWAYGITPDEQESLERYYDHLDWNKPRFSYSELYPESGGVEGVHGDAVARED